MPTVRQRYRRTDRQTDGWMTYDSNKKVKRHKNYNKTTTRKNTHDISQIQLCESLNELGELNNLRLKDNFIYDCYSRQKSLITLRTWSHDECMKHAHRILIATFQVNGITSCPFDFHSPFVPNLCFLMAGLCKGWYQKFWLSNQGPSSLPLAFPLSSSVNRYYISLGLITKKS